MPQLVEAGGGGTEEVASICEVEQIALFGHLDALDDRLLSKVGWASRRGIFRFMIG